jgi:fucose permease
LPVLYWVYWAAIVLAVAAEFCMISWSAGYLEAALGMPKADAAQAVSLFFIAMIVGRLAGSRLVQRISAHRLVPGSALVALAGFLLYWRAGSVPIGLAGLFLTGLGIASLYPLILSLAIGAAGAETVQASTRATLASGTAILTLPLVLGRLADAAGLRQAYGVVILLLVSVLLISLLTGARRGSRRPSPAPQSDGE